MPFSGQLDTQSWSGRLKPAESAVSLASAVTFYACQQRYPFLILRSPASPYYVCPPICVFTVFRASPRESHAIHPSGQDYYRNIPKSERPSKWWIADLLARILEPFSSGECGTLLLFPRKRMRW